MAVSDLSTGMAVLTDAADAAAFLDQRPGPDTVLPLTPAARAPLQGAGLNIEEPLGRYGDWRQACTAVRVDRARRRLLAALGSAPATAREAVLDLFNRAAYGAYRLWYTLGARGPWWVPVDGGWRRTDDRVEAHTYLLRRMLTAKVAGEEAAATIRRPPLPAFYRLLRDVLLRRLARHHRLVLVGAAKGQFGLFEHLTGYPRVRTVLAYLPTQGWREYVRLARSAWSARRPGGLLQVALVPDRPKPDTVTAERLVSAVDDDVIGRAFSHYRAFLACRIGQVEPGLADAAKIVGIARPIAYTAAEISRMSDWLLAEAAGRADVPRVVMGRNAYAPAEGRIAQGSVAGYFHARYPEGLVDRYLFWSPPSVVAAQQAVSKHRWSAIHGFRALDVPSGAQTAPTGGRTVLVADSFASWWYPHGWFMQTSDEYFVALAALVEVVGGMQGVRLVVRAKAKHEADLASYRALLALPANCTIKMRDVPFVRDLDSATLLVSFHSTTIQEALHARVPVLLWGGTRRYRYFPARSKPPTPDDRAAIYAPATDQELQPLLAAILDSHTGRPLTDDEIAPYVWTTPYPSVAEIAAAMVAGGPQSYDIPLAVPSRRAG